MIELTGDYEFAAPPGLVWEMFLDPAVLARIIPGCEALTQTGPHEYEGRMKIRVGPVQGVFQGTVTLSDLQPTHGYHLAINGRGPAGIVRGEGDLWLEPSTAGTELRYEGEAQVSGRIATVGQRLMVSSARAITQQSLQNMEKQIAARLQPEPNVAPDVEPDTVVAAPTPSTMPPAPSQTEFMLGVTQDVIKDLIPDPRQRQLLAGLALVLAVIGLVNWFTNLVARRVAKKLQEERLRD